MTTTTEARTQLVEATGRLAVYSLLSAGLAFPDHARLGVLGSRLVPAVAALLLPVSLEDVFASVSKSVPGDLDVAREHHMALFPPIASQDAPGYETGYRGDGIFQQAALIADVSGFYRAHGLRAGGSERERPDHVTVELEFMAVLARKEALALRDGAEENVSVCRESAVSFLRDHLGCWAPAFGRRASAVTRSPWLGALGEMLALWVEADMKALDVQPAEVVEGPLPQEPPDDGLCGPCPVSFPEVGR
jgi:TorA maturation chaperone TorD